MKTDSATNPNAIPPGIHHGLGMDRYHAWRLDKQNLRAGPISCSVLKNFAVSPYAWLRTPEKAPTQAMMTGSLLDLCLTEPDTVKDRVAIKEFPDFKTKASQEWRDAQLAAGKIICDGTELAHAFKCADTVRSHEVAGAILEGAQTQVGVIGQIGDIPAKCLLDILPGAGKWEETIFDYKTTSSGLDDEAIRKTIGQFRYHWQAGFYRTLFNKVSPDRVCDQFGFIFQDPMTREVRVVVLHPDDLALGTRCIGVCCREFVKAAHQGIRSRYERGHSTLQLMPYHSMNDDEWATNQEP